MAADRDREEIRDALLNGRGESRTASLPWWQKARERADALASVYLQESGLSAKEAAELALLQLGDRVVQRSRLTEEELVRFDEAHRYLVMCITIIEDLGEREDLSTARPQDLQDKGDTPGVDLSQDEVEYALKVIRELAESDRSLPGWGMLHYGDPIVLEAFPKAVDRYAEYVRLEEKATLSPEETTSRIDAILSGRGGRPGIELSAWLEERDAMDLALFVRFRLESLARENVEQELTRTKRDLESARRPRLRHGTGALRNLLTRQDRVEEARRKAQVSELPIDAEQLELRKIFVYRPLGWAERLVLSGLVSLAREEGLLEAHPWAKGRYPISGQPAPRVKMRYPGTSELARILGYDENDRGKIPRQDRRTLERALTKLCTETALIAVPTQVPVPQKKGETRWVLDIEVYRALWVEASHQVLSKDTYLSIHAGAVVSHLVSWLEMENYAARLDAAKKAIGQRQMRDEWVIADDYLRYLAGSILASTKEGSQQPSVQKRIRGETLREALGLEDIVRNRGASAADQRLREALDFCVEFGSLITAVPDGDCWDLVLPNPHVRAIQEELPLLTQQEITAE